MKRWLISAIVALSVMGLERSAWAASLATCTASATSVSFGTYDTLSSSPLPGTGNVQVSCELVLGLSLLVAYQITLSTGQGTYAQRTLKAGVATMNYNLFTGSNYGTVWGDGTAGTGVVVDGYLLGLGGGTTNYTIFGRIPALQKAAGGVYGDTIVVGVNY